MGNYEVGSEHEFTQDKVVYRVRIDRILGNNGTSEYLVQILRVLRHLTNERVLFELEPGRRLRLRMKLEEKV